MRPGLFVVRGQLEALVEDDVEAEDVRQVQVDGGPRADDERGQAGATQPPLQFLLRRRQTPSAGASRRHPTRRTCRSAGAAGHGRQQGEDGAAAVLQAEDVGQFRRVLQSLQHQRDGRLLFLDDEKPWYHQSFGGGGGRNESRWKPIKKK